jgi:asparagine synthetase B (glutamine-hydrolysing)
VEQRHPASPSNRPEWGSPDAVRFPLRRGTRGDQPELVVWGVTGSERDRVVAALRRGDDPVEAPQQPWAAVVPRNDGSLVATSSTTLSSGLCWTVDTNAAGQPELIISHDLTAVVRARTTPSELDGDWLRARLSGFLQSEATTPYVGVHHLPSGLTGVWEAGREQPTLVHWFDPERLPEPALEGEEAVSAYLSAFDATIDELVDPGAPIASTLSGGLDSSFVVASLVRHATPDNPIHCYTHSPHPDADLHPVGNWDPDDYEYALAMQRAYPGRVIVHRIINETLRDPLDFVVDASVRAGVPNFNTNGVWFETMSGDAAARGAKVLFQGTNGNAAFSYHHPYAGGYYLRRGDLASTAKLLGPTARQGQSFASNLRGLVGPLVPARMRRRRDAPLSSYLNAVGLGWMVAGSPATFSSIAGGDRNGYLAWLTGAGHRGVSGSPLAWSTTVVDPFATRRMVELAARIEPKRWRQGSLPRGFARELGVGRVPDEIRLRTRRGSQSADLWFAARGNRQRYLDEIDLLPETPHLGGWVDHRALRQAVAAWEWDALEGPPGWALPGLLHVLGLAGFIRAMDERLAEKTRAV